MLFVRKIMVAFVLATAISGCAAVDLATPLPTESTLVTIPAPGTAPENFAADKSTCLSQAHAKAGEAREARVTKSVLTTVGSVVLGAGLGAAGGGVYGVPGAGAAIGAASGAAVGTGYGAMASMTSTPDQRTFDAWYAKCIEEAGHSVRAPGGVAYGVPGVPLR